MKALIATAIVSVLLIAGIALWALAIGTPMSGEPWVRLEVDRPKDAAGGANEPSAEPAAAEQPTPAPVSNDLLEDSEFGPLPKKAADGRTAARVYARGARKPNDATPRIAIVMTGLGLNQPLSQQAVRRLPPAVSLAISPYGDELGEQAEEAQRTGHETLLQIPLEPADYPYDDAGPQTLLVADAASDNRSRLHWSLGRFTGYFAVANYRGGRFLASEDAVGPLFTELKERGLAFFSDDASDAGRLSSLAERQGLGYARADVELDREPDRASLDAALNQLEGLARRTGMAVGVVRLHEAMIERIAQWSQQLPERGLRLVPLSEAYPSN
jgi:polysaccharide deacetylase 2 family uncharacterized protein YibQ